MRRNRDLHELSEQFDLGEPNPAATLERAKSKYQEYLERGLPVQPAGWFWGRIILFTIFGILPGIGAALGALAIFEQAERESEPGYYILAGIVAAIAAFFLIAAYFGIAGARASSPKRALRLFYRLVAAGRHAGARKLVLPSDFDNFPRFFPGDGDIQGAPPTDPLFFDESDEFKGYWNALLRWPSSPTCIIKIRNIRIEPVTPDLLICDFRLRAGINTSLWLLLIFVPGVGVFIAAIIDAATRRWITREMTKVLVRVEDEWHLFNGAWQEHDEADLSWLPEGEADGQ